MNSHEVFIHSHQGCFAGTGAIVRLPQCQWSKPDGYGKISQCITTTKHSKARTVCIFLGIYCKYKTMAADDLDHLDIWLAAEMSTAVSNYVAYFLRHVQYEAEILARSSGVLMVNVIRNYHSLIRINNKKSNEHPSFCPDSDWLWIINYWQHHKPIIITRWFSHNIFHVPPNTYKKAVHSSLVQYKSSHHRADSRFAPSQWETMLLCNDVSPLNEGNLESTLYLMNDGTRHYVSRFLLIFVLTRKPRFS